MQSAERVGVVTSVADKIRSCFVGTYKEEVIVLKFEEEIEDEDYKR